MSRSKNLKRAKALHQKKVLNRQGNKTTEKRFNPFAPPKSDLSDVNLVIDREWIGGSYKVSRLVMDLVQPLLDEANDLEEVNTILSLGVLAWNSGIIRETSGEEALGLLLGHTATIDIPTRKLLDNLIELKCTKYKDYIDFIVEFDFSTDDGGGNFTVQTALNDKSIEDLSKLKTGIEDLFTKKGVKGIL
jgi:hypothetical protein